MVKTMNLESSMKRCQALLKKWGFSCFELKSIPPGFSVGKLNCFPEKLRVETPNKEFKTYTFTSEYLMCRFIREYLNRPKKAKPKSKIFKSKSHQSNLPKYYDAMERNRRKY